MALPVCNEAKEVFNEDLISRHLVLPKTVFRWAMVLSIKFESECLALLVLQLQNSWQHVWLLNETSHHSVFQG